MAPNFSALLRKPAGEAKKPPALPAADYPAVLSSFELGDNNKNKTPYVRFMVKLTGWAESLDESDRDSDIDLVKRQMRKDFYLTDDALWRLDEFMKSIGIEANGRTYEELFPEMMGMEVIAEVRQYMNQQTSEIGNQLEKLLPAE